MDKKMLSNTIKVGFAFALIMLFWNVYDFVIPLLLDNVYGLPDDIRGLIMGLDNLLSICLLPLFGNLSDKTKTRMGKRKPYILFGTIASVIFIIFVPITTIGQMNQAITYKEKVQVDSVLLTEFYDNAKGNLTENAERYVDLDYLEKNGITREKYINMAYAEIILDNSGKETKCYIYKNNKKILLSEGADVESAYNEQVLAYILKEIPCLSRNITKDGTSYSIITAMDTRESTESEFSLIKGNYNKYVKVGVNNYLGDMVYNDLTIANPTSLIFYMAMLLLALIAMAIFRSPAVALMPDVTPKPFRSQANAIINLEGGIGGAIGFIIYTIWFAISPTAYTQIFVSVGVGMIILLLCFMALVNEPKLLQYQAQKCKYLGLDENGDTLLNPEYFSSSITEQNAENNISGNENIQNSMKNCTESEISDVSDIISTSAIDPISEEIPDKCSAVSAKNVVENDSIHENKADTKNAKKRRHTREEKAKFLSFVLILGSIFMWFMGYNAVSSNLSVYATRNLLYEPSMAGLISAISMGISAIAFIPVGYLATKFGRKKSIIFGFLLAILSFLLIFLFVRVETKIWFTVFYLISGFGLIIANVNTFPMVVELSGNGDIGKYTGFYYTATMSAQAITPYIAGKFMLIKVEYLFLYSTICIALAVVLMWFVKHGDGKIINKKKKEVVIENND